MIHQLCLHRRIFRNHLLQADSDALCSAWMRALQRTIHYLHENDDTVLQQTGVKQITDGTPESVLTSHHESLLTELRRIPGNDICADCCVESPKWASINLGVSFNFSFFRSCVILVV